jgi:hypothetical protein
MEPIDILDYSQRSKDIALGANSLNVKRNKADCADTGRNV